MILLMTTAPPEDSPWGLGRRYPPLGLAYVAGSLEHAGYVVQIIDNYLLKKPINEIKQEVERLNPEIIGITCGSVTYRKCIETAKAVKQVLQNCRVVVGGWHPSYLPESMLKHPEIDYVVIGEGEQAIVELTNAIVSGKEKTEVSQISGIAYRKGNQIVKNLQTFIQDLDAVPFPARHLLPMDLYMRKMEYLAVEPVDNMNVIRGCPYNCAFCETKKIWTSKCRAFSPPRVVAELNHMIEKYGTKGIYFVGDNFTINKKRTIELCKEIKKEKLDLQWVCDTRVDLVSREMLQEMKSAGCKTIWFGVESGAPHILKRINKQITREQAVDAFKLCDQVGIRTASSFMIGLPGETVADMHTTYKFARKLDPDYARFHIFIGYPGSSMYDEIMANGWYERVEDFVTYVKTDQFDFELVKNLQREFHKNFNRSPHRILKTIRRDGFLSVLKRNI